MQNVEGRYIGAGEKNLYVKMNGLGDPPVVIETAMGSVSSEWWQIQEELSLKTTVITYDRAGYAESPKRKVQRNTKEIAMELFNMLRNSEAPGPYILVGHSFGGLVVQHFAKMFPNDVAGLVLVDSITVNDAVFDELDAPNYQKTISTKARMVNIKKLTEMEKDDFQEYVRPLLQNLYTNFPEGIAPLIIEYQADKALYDTVLAEYEAMPESIKLINEIRDFPNVPLKVLCHDYEVMAKLSKGIGLPEEEGRLVEEQWLKNNKELLGLSTNSEFFIIKNSNHSIHLTKPKAIIESVESIIKEIKQSG